MTTETAPNEPQSDDVKRALLRREHKKEAEKIKQETASQAELKKIKAANAFRTNEVRKAATEEKISKAFDKALREGIKLTQINIAKLSGLNVRTVKRYWSKF